MNINKPYFKEISLVTYDRVLPVSNQACRDIELTNIQHSVRRNDLELKVCDKSCEVIFRDTSRRHVMIWTWFLCHAASMTGALMHARVTRSLIVSVAFWQLLRSLNEYDDNVVIVRITYRLSVLNMHSPRHLTGSASTRWSTEPSAMHTVSQTCRLWRTVYISWREQLFTKTVHLSNHVLHALLLQLSVASQHYNLRDRTHSLHQLTEHSTH